MTKILAVVCVVAWSGFWVFGGLALTAGAAETGQVVIAILLAAFGFFAGMISWLRLSQDVRLPVRINP